MKLPRLSFRLATRRATTRLRSGRPSPRATVLWGATALILLHVAAFVAMDGMRPGLRDPEYGRRVNRLKARIGQYPTRPVVVVIGSSRASMGVCPAAWETTQPQTMLFNLSIAGSGPILQRLTLQRMLRDGVRPAGVLLEFWPPFLRQDGDYAELARIDPLRLSRTDPPLKGPHRTRWNAISENRHRWLVQLMPSWLPPAKRLDVNWSQFDPWGWLPGLDENDVLRAARLPSSEAYYRPALAGCVVDRTSDAAIRETVSLARQHGIAVGFVWLPESSEFRGWYPPATEKHHRDYLSRLCQDLTIPWIDAREWVDDARLTDGFHLSRRGAAEFTRKLGPAVVSTFPQWKATP